MAVLSRIEKSDIGDVQYLSHCSETENDNKSKASITIENRPKEQGLYHKR